ncbi:LacI family repressor for deo operon, udp, cdd, tsx, nupC, and nupG [Kitasatospora sp. MAP12-15]|uniref:LacI family DNA-binding transcriptional regulator n=1 Tax=unclassified Kitasatospora TaxID=2633591 RepID=UPI002474C878|nr:LacI family DNA-binding transcriptional regulator [Kitasatospora sp. MAP12-44]MDH6112352.1 LacI family repressor for deo operon, udp, cdd, tsx, nupC, and nupG [Kitasatospora sp. MAP12-44]
MANQPPTPQDPAVKPRRPTGRDVAQLAGVSQATVSLVFSTAVAGHRVSEATRQRVLDAARGLGYRPQAAGRQLRLGRSGMALLAVPNLQGPFFGRVLAGVHEEAARHDLAVVVSSGWSAATLAEAATTSRFDGLLICSPDDAQLGELPPGTPAVFLDADPAVAGGAPTIELDLAGGMRAVMAHLVGLGHRRIGRLRSTHSAYTFRVRQAAFEEAARGLEVLELGVSLNRGEAAARVAGRELLDRPDRPRAVVCDDDVVASGLYQAAAELGLRIPADVSVVGIDNVAVAELLTPPLTTVDLPGERLGQAGIAALAALLHGEPVLPVQPLATSLVVRNSTTSA